MSIPPFTFTGSSQTFTVPTSGVYDITAFGAQGGSDPSGGTGGYGAEIEGEFSLTAGDSIFIAVGGQGGNGRSTYGGAGGGGSFVVDTTTGQILVIAGGGGGGYNTNGAGGLAGSGGTGQGGTGALRLGGGGGGFASGGAGAYFSAGGGYPGLAGGVTAWNGGANGGFGGGGASGGYGAGGGGGYSGGNANGYGGGGGGSLDKGTALLALGGENTGNGEVTFNLVSSLCFLRDTRILTPNGEVPVEHLAAGDEVMTFSGQARRIVWIGQGRVLATRGRRNAATPVIMRKGALAENVPSHDLRVTKAHGIYIDGVLIPVEFLVNHRSIVWDDHAQEVSLYHIELETHDILLADGTPAESYRDDGNRWLFHNANSGWHLPPQESCAPVLTGGPVVDAVWKRLLDRAGPRHLPPVTDDPDLHLHVNSRRIDPIRIDGTAHVFRLPARPTDIRIVSRDAIPAELGIARDPRVLGVAIRRIVLRQGTRFTVIGAADERLTQGFHDHEPKHDLRWTDGNATLPADLLARFTGELEIVLTLAGTTRYLDGTVSGNGHTNTRWCPASAA